MRPLRLSRRSLRLRRSNVSSVCFHLVGAKGEGTTCQFGWIGRRLIGILGGTLRDLQMMERCLELAQRGVDKGELPFGAVIASRGQVVAEATNCVSSEGDVTRHAELVAISDAQKVLKRKRLQDCTLYTIVEPCPMCSFPAREARIGRVVFALSSPVMGGYSKWDVLKDARSIEQVARGFWTSAGNRLRPVVRPGRAGLESVAPTRLAHHETKRLHRSAGGPACAPCGCAAPRRFLERLWFHLAAPALSVSRAILRLRGGSRK